MSKFSRQLTEIFGTTGFFNTASGIAQLTPGVLSTQNAINIAKESGLDRAIKDCGIVVAREVSQDLLKKGLRPADYSANVEMLDSILDRVKTRLEKDPSMFLKSVSEQQAKIG